ncbi:hypothetical protein PROFUN_03742 [Planoprotostelium fungivorum]|uniref:Uncharacterized protein n=1 Tax=Planoprotostelium fungivorum TaxID=1890364 RepID=A0A2P6NDQ6_9EUKA|nr:hypothetical protein PROFUN_03742 [Planoprotostelium fungivorum]
MSGSVNTDETRPLLSKTFNEENEVKSHVANAKYVLFTNIILSMVNAGFTGILAIYFKDSMGLSESFATTATMAGVAIACSMSMVGGNIADSFWGHAKTLRAGLFCLLVAYGVLLASRLTYIFVDNEHLFRIVSCCAICCVYLSGFYKPCISTLMGDQFLPSEDALRSKYFSWFYMSIQVGSVVSTALAPVLFNNVGYIHRPTSLKDGPTILFICILSFLALGVGVLMVPWKHYVKNPAKGNFLFKCLGIVWRGMTGKRSAGEEHWLDKSASVYTREEVEDTKHTLNVLKVFITLPLFWGIFMQMNASWVWQAERMNRDVTLHYRRKSLSFTIPAASVGTANPLLDIVLIPAFSYGFYPLCKYLGFPLSELKRMGLGQLFAVGALIAQSLIELIMSKHPAGEVSIWWILIQYFLISCAEILLAISAYEFAYSQATARTRGTVTAVWLLTLSTGSLLAAIFPYIPLSKVILPGTLAGVQFLLFVVFLFISWNYQPRVEEKIEEIPKGDSLE